MLYHYNQIRNDALIFISVSNKDEALILQEKLKLQAQSDHIGILFSFLSNIEIQSLLHFINDMKEKKFS